MLESLKNLNSYEAFKYFKEMNQIPRGSGNEKAVSDWLVAFAKKHNLEVIQDEALNVIIKKPGTKGYENAPTVILQGHMDMVCEKNLDTVHDFEKDPIKFIVDGDFLRADGTTLGADDGIAVAFCLAILASDDIPHPPLEVLITTEEETGMGGAIAVDPKNLSGRYLINIDSEEEGKLLVSCAGGVRELIKLPIKWEDAPYDYVTYLVKIRGLKGGHSGMEINKYRGNSNKLMARFLNDLESAIDFKVASLNGGAKMNAIPREFDAVILVKDENKVALEEKVKEWNAIFKNELQAQDPDVSLTFEEHERVTKVFSDETASKAIMTLLIIPNGIQTMSMAIEGLVESSTNIGVVTTEEDKIVFESALRSSVKTLKYEIAERGKAIAKLVGAEIEFLSDYPEWQYNPDSKLREICLKVYKDMYGKDAQIDAIHAGLECGLLGDKFNGQLDMISMGPNLYDVHTPDEHLSISSAERMWNYLIEVLKEIK
ncbi:cytosol non-specific dipeptidase [Clostridium tepidiprofundi DSM 19306]|uniref:Cytosol non-specific dipeptidase n=1 Tax=Clostridium tepidiprofundi DSM 19306 TaxID=1121338 RepID=A0A151B4A8_9CLOT|nr:aminoacyl-histidine dipeptidase [Clostridium tepidiprofundi]KYH34726.1 cytosol non-specific dipeptidase [Clostridium tepidiprofundi DSM 19306]